MDLRDQCVRSGGEDGQDGVSDVVDAEPVGRVAPAREVGRGRAGTDRRHLDPEVAELEHARLGQAHEAELGRVVAGQVRVGDQAGDRGDVDDCARALPLHRRHDRARAQEGPAQVDAEHLVELLERQLVDRPEVAEPRVVDQHVEPAVALERRLRHDVDGAVVAHVGGDDQRLAAKRFDLAGQGLEVGDGAGGEGDVRARPGQRQRDAATDAPRRTGDERDLLGQRLGGG